MGDLGEALLLGHVGEAGVVVLPLLVLVVLGGPQVLHQGGVEVHGIGAVDGDVLPGALLQVVVEGLGVGPLLVGGEGKDGLDDLQAVLLGQTGGEGIAVAGLALTGKGSEDVAFGLAVFKGNGHGDTPFMDGISMSIFCGVIRYEMARPRESS